MCSWNLSCVLFELKIVKCSSRHQLPTWRLHYSRHWVSVNQTKWIPLLRERLGGAADFLATYIVKDGASQKPHRRKDHHVSTTSTWIRKQSFMDRETKQVIKGVNCTWNLVTDLDSARRRGLTSRTPGYGAVTICGSKVRPLQTT